MACFLYQVFMLQCTSHFNFFLGQSLDFMDRYLIPGAGLSQTMRYRGCCEPHLPQSYFHPPTP